MTSLCTYEAASKQFTTFNHNHNFLADISVF